MDVEDLIGTMIQGTLVGGGKRSHGTSRFLRTGGNPFLNASTLLTVGGLVWGAIETMQQQRAGAGSTVPSSQPIGGMPLPQAPNSADVGSAGAPPPLPGPEPAVAPATAPDEPEPAVPEGAAKLVRLMVSAARADGALDEAERRAILEHARQAGAEALVGHELQHPTPLPAIVDGITDDRQRADLYTLAYAIVRADESVSGSEQIYLAQLASLLGLEPSTVERLEAEAVDRIAAEAAGR